MSKWGTIGDANYLKVSRNTCYLITRVFRAQHNIKFQCTTCDFTYLFFMSFGIFQNIVIFYNQQLTICDQTIEGVFSEIRGQATLKQLKYGTYYISSASATRTTRFYVNHDSSNHNLGSQDIPAFMGLPKANPRLSVKTSSY